MVAGVAERDPGNTRIVLAAAETTDSAKTCINSKRLPQSKDCVQELNPIFSSKCNDLIIFTFHRTYFPFKKIP